MGDKIIALNRMYSGDYLKQGNLGHEVINLYKSDNGNNYIYLTKSGEINKVHSGRIHCVLLVRGVGNCRLEIIGKAEGIEDIYGRYNQQEYIQKNNIRYGEVLLSDLFSDNLSHQEICVTFKAERVLRPLKPLFIQYGSGKDEHKDNITILYDVNQARQSLRQFISESCEHDYNALNDIINDNKLWGEEVAYVADTTSNGLLPTTMFDICGISYSELAYSHSLYYFLSSDTDFAQDFVKNVLGIKEGLVGAHKVYREWYNIDLFIEDEKKTIIVENKIKSSINGVFISNTNKKDSQLDRYIETVEKECKGKKIHPFLLAPNYNKIDISNFNHKKQYSHIFYKEVYDFMKSYKSYLSDPYFHDFTNAMERHTAEYDNELYYTMTKIFTKRIQEKQLAKNK